MQEDGAEELQSLVTQMVRDHGHMLTGDSLWMALGFKSAAAFRQARLREQVGVKIFKIKHRRGAFAYTADVAAWIYQAGRSEATPQS